jgi:predicted HTH domain antitoxin
MAVLHIPYDEGLLVSSGQSGEEFESELRFLLAAKLYELGRISAGQAGKLAGMPRLRFLDELGRRGFTVIHLEQESIEDELKDDPPEVHQ